MVGFLGMLLLAALPTVELRTLDGRQISGELEICQANEVRVKTASGSEAIPADQIWELTPTASTPAQKNPAATISVQLTDGTAVLAEDYRVTEQHAAEIKLGNGESLNAPTSSVAHVKFAVSGELEASWQEILAKNAASDLVVVKRDGALDYLEGVLGPTDQDGAFAFTLDGDTLNVKRSRLAGIAYFHKAGDALPAAAALVSDTHGNQFAAAVLKLEDHALRGETPSGAAWSVPLESLAKVDYSQGRVAYLSDLPPVKKEWTALLKSGALPSSAVAFFGPKLNQGLEARELRMRGQRYTKGLALRSRSEVAYRLDGQYRRFQALVGIDDDTAGLGAVRLVIRADDRVLWEGEVTAGQEPQMLNLAIENVRALSILVDYGASQEISDHLNLCDAKVIR